LQPTAFVIAVFEFVLLLFSLSFHECAHAWMASRLGDQTARLQGRITLNPMYHVDPIGTLLFPALVIFGPLIGFHLPFMLVGWAKPTPVITRNFKKIVRDDNLTTLAGPFSNLVLVCIALLGLIVMGVAMPKGGDIVRASFVVAMDPLHLGQAHPVALLLSLAILINFSLFFFNLLPIPPLDGSRVVRNMLPYNAVRVYDRIGGWISYLLMIFVGSFLLRLLLWPALGLVFSLLGRL
jgi:Zn-dependent protease